MKAKDNEHEPFSLMMNFPKKIFRTEDYDKPLESLGKQCFLFFWHIMFYIVAKINFVIDKKVPGN